MRIAKMLFVVLGVFFLSSHKTHPSVNVLDFLCAKSWMARSSIPVLRSAVVFRCSSETMQGGGWVRSARQSLGTGARVRTCKMRIRTTILDYIASPELVLFFVVFVFWLFLVPLFSPNRAKQVFFAGVLIPAKLYGPLVTDLWTLTFRATVWIFRWIHKE